MVVKFILTTDGKIFFGHKHYSGEFHADVAYKNHVPSGQVAGGGLADLEKKRIFGTSYGFGSYDVTKVKQILPDWRVDLPSDY